MQLNIIGAGKVGAVFGLLFANRQVFRIQSILNRSLGSAARAVGFIGEGSPFEKYSDLPFADVYMLTVPDDQIVEACQQLARHGHLMQGTIVFHCSGALPSSVMLPALEAGSEVASLHPIRSFADPASVASTFDASFCSLEGTPAACAVLRPALEKIGARVIPVDARAKTLYHAASVFACNYLVTLLDIALRAYVAAGVPADLAAQLAQPLVNETLHNLFQMGPEQALTGPIARGDMATVARQQAAVTGWDRQAGKVYAELAEATLDLAKRKNNPG